MLSEREVSAAIGSPAFGPDGEKIGTVEHFFVDDRTGAPTWAAVTTGLFGTRHSIVPAVDAAYVDGGLRLPVTRDAVRSAPHLTGDHLDPADEAQLRRHYGLDTALPATPEVAPAAPPPPAAAAPPPSTAPASDGAMTRSEERLRVTTERVPVKRARLVKYVVTEEVQITVPIRREEFRIEELPLDAPPSGDSLAASVDPATPITSPIPVVSGGLPEEIVLHAERPVVSVEVVPVERIRLRTELVPDTEQVTAQVQRERIVVDRSGSPAPS